MNTVRRIEKIEMLHRLIRSEHTGNSLELSVRLGIAQRTVQAYLQELRDYGADISFDSIRRTYIYKNKFDLKFVFEITVAV